MSEADVVMLDVGLKLYAVASTVRVDVPIYSINWVLGLRLAGLGSEVGSCMYRYFRAKVKVHRVT